MNLAVKAASWPAGEGEMARRIRAHDWAGTPLGPVADWPQSLRTAVDIMLGSPGPASVLWGPRRVQIYNDAYRPIAAERHPDLLGRPASDGWPEAYEALLGPLLDQVFEGRPAVIEDQVVPLRAHDGGVEDRAFTGAFSPIRDEAGAVAGVFHPLVETTAKVRADAALRDGEARLRGMTEAIEDVFYVTDLRARRLLYLSPSYERVWGRPAAEVMANLGRFAGTIHPDDRAALAIAMEGQARGEPVAVEYRILRPDGAVRWVADRSFPLEGQEGRLSAGLAADITERKLTALRLTALVEGIPQLVWRAVDGGHWTWSSPQWSSFAGQSEEDSRGLGWLGAIHPDDRERAMQAWREAVNTGALDVEYRIRRASDGVHRWFASRAAVVRDAATGALVEWLGTSTDVQAMKELQDRQGVLVSELQHRTRNLVAVIRAMADRTLDGSASLPEFRDSFRARLDAIARVNGLLSRLHEGKRLTFDELIRTELSAHGVVDGHGMGPQVTLHGPGGVWLRSTTVQTFALALHELATNALKHGALSRPGGRLEVGWGLLPGEDGGRQLRVDWRETGALPPAMPPRQGYGRELIERALPYQLGAETSYDLGPGGVRCVITLPVSSRGGRDAPPPAAPSPLGA